MTSTRPSIEHLRVFGCGAYVFLPAEVRANKLAPRSELMVYLGNHPGGKGWIFMRGPNNVIFSAAQATFDESLFPRCPKDKTRKNTRLQDPTPAPPSTICPKDGSCHCPSQEDDDEEQFDEPLRVKEKSTETPLEAPGNDALSRPTDPLPERQPSPVLPPPVQPPQPGPRRGQRERKVPKRYGENVYGDKHPTQILKDTSRQRDWG